MDKTVLEKYTKTYGTRFSRRQKKRFIEALHQDFHALGYEPTMIEGKKLLSHAHNYLYGNMKQMKTVIVVPYDTPERKFWKKVLYFPFDGTKTANKTMVATYVPIFLFFALIFGGLYGLQPLITSTGLASLISCGLFLLTVMLMYWMMHGFHNAHNYNRNSATIAAAVEIAKGLNRDERKKVGFLLPIRTRCVLSVQRQPQRIWQMRGRIRRSSVWTASQRAVSYRSASIRRTVSWQMK